MKVVTGALELLESLEQRATRGAGACLPLALIFSGEELKDIRAALEAGGGELVNRITSEIVLHLGGIARDGARRRETLELEATGAIEVHRASRR